VSAILGVGVHLTADALEAPDSAADRAIREAVRKAVGDEGVVVRRTSAGAPIAEIPARPDLSLHVSASHEDGYVIGVAIASSAGAEG
jgi:phosphopantetheinyl transferase (holo-ACP synthase)